MLKQKKNTRKVGKQLSLICALFLNRVKINNKYHSLISLRVLLRLMSLKNNYGCFKINACMVCRYGSYLVAGIYCTGFSTVNWLLYLPAASFIFAAITGICPSLIAISKMFGFSIRGTSNR